MGSLSAESFSDLSGLSKFESMQAGDGREKGKKGRARKNPYDSPEILFFRIIAYGTDSGRNEILSGRRAEIGASVHFFLGRGLGTINSYDLFSPDLGGRMLSLMRALGLYLVICFCVECHSTVIVHKENSRPLSSIHTPPGKRNKQANTFFGIYSLSDSEEASCQDLPGEVKMVRTIPDTLIHFFAGPFYTTRTVEVYCSSWQDKDAEEKKNEVKTVPKENQDGKEAVKPNSSPVPDRPKPNVERFEAQDMSENKETKDLKEKPKVKKNNVFDSQF